MLKNERLADGQKDFRLYFFVFKSLWVTRIAFCEKQNDVPVPTKVQKVFVVIRDDSELAELFLLHWGSGFGLALVVKEQRVDLVLEIYLPHLKRKDIEHLVQNCYELHVAVPSGNLLDSLLGRVVKSQKLIFLFGVLKENDFDF